jgi:hypothetical protein
MNTVRYIAGRMKEASSYAGLVGAALAMIHVSADPNVVTQAIGAVAAIGGLVAVLLPEKA